MTDKQNVKLIDIDQIFKTVYSGSKNVVAKVLNCSTEYVSKYRSLDYLPELGLPSVDPYILLIYINDENNKFLTSNEKKILNLLILGDNETVDPDKALTCDPDRDKKLYSYFEGLKWKKDQKGKSKAVPYRPGRSVARYQIWDLGNKYGYTRTKINKALKGLVDFGLIEEYPYKVKQNKNDRFKLSVEGCADYIAKKKASEAK